MTTGRQFTCSKTYSLSCVVAFLLVSSASAQVQPAADGPEPLSPEDARKSFRVPEGFRMELVASEPLITEPSGVCWDEHGRLYVSELHGYNLEGQYDIEALNRSGEFDRVVRRIQANDEAKQAALAGTYGVIKRLTDSDSDGCMDGMTIFADGLPPCYGVVPARGGVIVACAPDIVYLRDDDDDGRAEVREVLFTGFRTGALERGINAPQWGPDNWIYIGRGHGGGTITGPHLAEPVELGGNDFRIRADGSAIEPVPGNTHTFGFTFDEAGNRFAITTTIAGMQVAPLPWRYLTRNPDVAFPGLQRNAADYTRVFPRAATHPWRVRRASDPGFFKYYRDRYGVSDSDAGGYFTSACSPLVYQDTVFPPEYLGDYFVCEPAQNLIHRAKVEHDGTQSRLVRPENESQSEFLASTDPWFHPMNLTHGPDGSIYITDFYREIIEDYSAIPRYLQQQYGFTNGVNHGRVWRLTTNQRADRVSSDLAVLYDAQLADEVFSNSLWRRQTARRLLIERHAGGIASSIAAKLQASPREDTAIVNALFTLEGIGGLSSDLLATLWGTASPVVKRQILRIADQNFDGVGSSIQNLILAKGDLPDDPFLLLQYALSLGEVRDSRSLDQLAGLAGKHGEIHWMDLAVLSSIGGHEVDLLALLLDAPGKSQPWLETIVATVASRAEKPEIERALNVVAKSATPEQAALFTRILESGLATSEQELAHLKIDPPEPPSTEYLQALQKQLPVFVAALAAERNVARGRDLFAEHCASCHLAKGVGSTTGPGLDAEFQRAEETILRDILFPHETISAGYETTRLEMRRGPDVIGIRGSESPTSYTMKFPGGAEMTFLRKNIDRVHQFPVSLMPSTFGDPLHPDEVADIIAFLREN
jgi:putative membrane-bound dehydrogenase-like protein